MVESLQQSIPNKKMPKSADPPVERVDPSSFLLIFSKILQTSIPPYHKGEVYLPFTPSLATARRGRIGLGHPRGPFFQDLPDFRRTFSDHTSCRKNIVFQNLPKSTKKIEIRSSSAQGSHFHDFLMPFRHPFFIKIPHRRNLVFCKKYQAGAPFWPCKIFHFRIRFPSEFQISFASGPRPVFSSFYPTCAPKTWFWDPL